MYTCQYNTCKRGSGSHNIEKESYTSDQPPYQGTFNYLSLHAIMSFRKHKTSEGGWFNNCIVPQLFAIKCHLLITLIANSLDTDQA